MKEKLGRKKRAKEEGEPKEKRSILTRLCRSMGRAKDEPEDSPQNEPDPPEGMSEEAQAKEELEDGLQDVPDEPEGKPKKTRSMLTRLCRKLDSESMKWAKKPMGKKWRRNPLDLLKLEDYAKVANIRKILRKSEKVPSEPGLGKVAGLLPSPPTPSPELTLTKPTKSTRVLLPNKLPNPADQFTIGVTGIGLILGGSALTGHDEGLGMLLVITGIFVVFCGLCWGQ